MKSNQHQDQLIRFLLCVSSLLAILFVTTAVRSPSSDGFVRYETFLSLFSDAPAYSKYSTIGPLIAKILDLSVRGYFPSLPIDFFPKYLELSLYIVFSLLLLTVTKFKMNSLFIISILPLSLLSHYAGQFFAEWTSSFLLAIGFLIFLISKRVFALFLGAVVVGLGLANWPILIASLLIVLVLATIDYFTSDSKKDTAFIRFLFMAAFFAFAFTVIDLYIKGHLFQNPYSSDLEKGFETFLPYSGLPGFSHPIFIGFLGSIFSFGKSVFLFNPFLLFIFTEKYIYKKYLITSFLTALVIYSQWWAWYGGFSFGTRFYTFLIIPSIFLFVHHIRSNYFYRKPFFGVAILLLSMWLAISGKHFGLDGVSGVCTMNNYAFEAFCWYVPEFSPLIYPFINYDFSEILSRLTFLDISYLLSLITVLFLILNPRRKCEF